MHRRNFLKLSAALGLAGCSQRLPWQSPPISVLMPGMSIGHELRDGLPQPDPAHEQQVDVAILGSGAAGLFAGWRLAQQGYNNFCVLNGPEANGNAAGGMLGGIACPRGAHYLPLPSMESLHVREMLAAFGVLQGPANAEKPRFDENVLVHAPEERLLMNGVWQDSLLPQHGLSSEEATQIARFSAAMLAFRNAIGKDGRRAFAIPLVKSSSDAAFRELDRESFASWLTRQGFTAAPLRWYADYCCRDDYGANANAVSAWAGIHYFASRGSHAANGEDGAVLTWPDGLHALATRLRQAIGVQGFIDGTALKVTQRGQGVEVLCLNENGRSSFLLKAKRVIVAMPLHVAGRIIDLAEFGFDKTRDLPQSAAWMVSNFLLDGFPPEADIHQPLAWDNVVYGSQSLGWVNATHQWIRLAKPAKTVFTAYHAFADQSPTNVRAWMLNARPEALLERASEDLKNAYGRGFSRYIQEVEISLRGHAMAIPTPGFLSRSGIEVLRAADERILFAHADLSGLSVFEEASWWGEQAARRTLR